jgi:hypothetical protein
MRRFTVLLLFLVLIPVLLPLLAIPGSTSSSQIPECCRRDGHHHCAATAENESQTPGASFRQQSPACPYRSSFTLIRNLTPHPAPSAVFYASIVVHPVDHAQVSIQWLVSEARSHLKRGPPSLRSC